MSCALARAVTPKTRRNTTPKPYLEDPPRIRPLLEHGARDALARLHLPPLVRAHPLHALDGGGAAVDHLAQRLAVRPLHPTHREELVPIGVEDVRLRLHRQTARGTEHVVLRVLTRRRRAPADGVDVVDHVLADVRFVGSLSVLMVFNRF